MQAKETWAEIGVNQSEEKAIIMQAKKHGLKQWLILMRRKKLFHVSVSITKNLAIGVYNSNPNSEQYDNKKELVPKHLYSLFRFQYIYPSGLVCC